MGAKESARRRTNTSLFEKASGSGASSKPRESPEAIAQRLWQNCAVDISGISVQKWPARAPGRSAPAAWSPPSRQEAHMNMAKSDGEKASRQSWARALAASRNAPAGRCRVRTKPRREVDRL